MPGVDCIGNGTIAPGLVYSLVLVTFLWSNHDEVTASFMEAAA